ncbi:MAG: DUF6497 family protein [Sedimentitalea sp.]
MILCVANVGLANIAPAHAEISVPSGQAVTLNEVLIDENPGERWLRFRFVAPAIARAGGAISYDQAAADMDHLCASLALPYMSEQGLSAVRIVISMMDRRVDFGAPAPDATQFFEAYRPENATCIWEEF